MQKAIKVNSLCEHQRNCLKFKKAFKFVFYFYVRIKQLEVVYHIKVTGWAYLRSAICLSLTRNALKLSANRRHFIVAAIKSLKSVEREERRGSSL